MSMLRRTGRVLLSPWRRLSLWTAIIAVIAYCDSQALHGNFVYDDAGSVRKNPLVTGQVGPFWGELFKRDFWGTPLSEPASHKSFRPITTITLRWNWLWSNNNTNRPSAGDVHDTLSFHIVNVALHGVVTALVTEAAAYVFCGSGSLVADGVAQLLTGLLFGLHPVHAEAVSNITSRGEILMSLFFLLAFLSFASQVIQPTPPTTALGRLRSFLGIYVVPWLCMTTSVFSKEQGATALITCVLYDFLQHHGCIVNYFRGLSQGRSRELAFLRRTAILAIETIIIVAWRYILNGPNIPDFVHDQNPAGFAEDRFTRIFSVNWVYCLYLWDAVYPVNLCCDWSGLSIPLIEQWNDPRILGVLALWAFTAASVWSLIVGLDKDASPRLVRIRRIVLLSFFAFMFSPFLLSSNLLVTVGLMKADRVIYLPLLGFCVVEALAFQVFFCPASPSGSGESKDKTVGSSGVFSGTSASNNKRYWQGHLLVIAQLAFFCAKVHERNRAWGHPFTLWETAYAINPVSRHTIYNFGYEMSIKKRYEEAEEILRPIADPTIEGPSNTFVYAMVLYNLGRCDDTNRYLDHAFEVVEQKRTENDKRYTPQNLARVESNLLMARAYCKDTIIEAGETMYKAVQVDPTNDYAIEQAMVASKQLEMFKMMQEQQARGMGLR